MAGDDHGFATIQDVAVTGLFSAGGDIVQVVEALGFLQGHGRFQLAAGNATQPLLSLTVVARLGDQAATEDNGLQIRLQAKAAAQFRHHGLDFNATAAKATEFLGKRHGGQAQLTELAPECLAETGFGFAEFQALFKTVLAANQAGHGVLQHLLLFIQSEIHGRLLKAQESFLTRCFSGSRWIRQKSRAYGY